MSHSSTKPSHVVVLVYALVFIMPSCAPDTSGAGEFTMRTGDDEQAEGAEPAFSSARTSYGESTKQVTATTSDEQSTGSREFVPIQGLSGLDTCRPYLTVTFVATLELSGGPAELRMTSDPPSPSVLKPGSYSSPGSRRFTPVTLTFVFKGSEEPTTHVFQFEWRSKTGRPIHLTRGAVVGQFGPHADDQGTCA